MSKKTITRRDFIRLTAAAGGGVLAVACGPAAQPAAPGVAATSAPAVPTAAAAEPVPGEFLFSTWGDFRMYEDGFKRMQKNNPQYASVTFKNSQAQSSTQLLQRLLTDWTAKSYETMPDVAEMPTSNIPELADAGVLVDLSSRMAPFEKDIAPAILEMLRRSGKLYAVPWRGNSGMIWYRKDVWDTAGVSAEKIETWDDFLAAGKTVTNFSYPDGRKRFMTNVGATSPNNWQVQMMLGQQGGGQFFDPQTGDTTIDRDPKFRNAFTTWVRVVTEGIATRTDDFKAPWYTALEEGTISCHVSAIWMDQIIQLNMPKAKGKFRAMPLPSFVRGTPMGAFQAGSANVVAINKPNLNLDLAWTFMQHSFLNKDVTPHLLNDWKLPPAHLPSYASPVYGPVDFYGGQDISKLDRQIQAVAKPFHFTKDYTQALSLIMEQVEKAWSGKAIDQAIADAAAAIRQKIGKSF